MYAGEKAPQSLRGGLAVAVPGELAGLHAAWLRHGRLPWSRLVEPVAQLAGGFRVDAKLARAIADSAPHMGAAMLAVFAPGGRPLAEGELCANTALQKTLRRVAAKGPSEFYSGDLAAAMAAAAQSQVSWSEADFAGALCRN